MGMRHELSVGATLEQRLSPVQKLEARKELSLEQQRALSELSETSRDQTLDVAETGLHNHLVAAAGTLFPPEAQIEKIFDKALCREMCQNPEGLATGQLPQIRLFYAQQVWEQHRGQFNQEGSVNSFKVIKPDFITAFRNPGHLQSEIKKSLEYVRAARDKDISSMMGRIHEMEDALKVAELLEEYVGPMAQATHTLLTQDHTEQSPSAPISYLRELAFAERANSIISERTLKRFGERTKGSFLRSPENFKNPFLNTIAEYLLVSMGVVSPDIFKLHTHEIEQNEYKDLKDDLAKAGLDLTAILKYYDLKESGTIFWNRWAVKGVKPSRAADDQVRAFITDACRNPKHGILEGLQYDIFYERLKSEVGMAEPDDKKTTARNTLVEHLEQPHIQTFVNNLCKTTLYPEIAKLYATI